MTPVHEGRLLGVKYSDLVPVLVEAIKSLDAKESQIHQKHVDIQHRVELALEVDTKAEKSCDEALTVVEALKVRLQDLESRNGLLRTELESRIRDLNAQNEQLKSNLETQKVARTELESRIRDLNAQNEQLKSSLETQKSRS